MSEVTIASSAFHELLGSVDLQWALAVPGTPERDGCALYARRT